MHRQPTYDHLLRVRPEGEILRDMDRHARQLRQIARRGHEPIIEPVTISHEHGAYLIVPLWFAETVGSTVADVNTTFVDIDFAFGAGTLTIKTYIDFSLLVPCEARVYASATGNEAGNGKAIRITTDAGTELAALTWNGSSHGFHIGAWTPISATDIDTLVKGQWKGSSATEDLTLYRLEIQLRGRARLA